MYTSNNWIITYTPKDNYVFNTVSKGTKVIWESTDDVCGTLVRIKLFSNNERFLAIILDNNTFKLFRQSGNTWKDITGTRYDITKLKFFGENETELKSSDFAVSFVDFFYSFNFRNISKCLKVTYDEKVVWKHTDDRGFSDITTFYFGLASNRFFVKNRYGRFMKLDFKASIQTLTTTGTPKASTPGSPN